MDLPSLPAPIADFVPYLASQPHVSEALQPYKDYETKLRRTFARHRENDGFYTDHVNTLPLFAGYERSFKIRSRDIQHEIVQERDKYLLSLPDVDRRPNGSSAIVGSFKEFRSNFNLFSESSLVDLDWSNVIAAGSSVVTSLLPVDAPHNESKKAQRLYYHDKLAPASDVDLFIYGLSEEQAVEKIKQIETKVRDSILSETTTIRTKHAITIASQYPTRHVQVVLRLYHSISEILTGFDVDCSCVAYDGSQVWAAPRAVAAFMTQINTIDLSRRSPSYENRLSKYSRRGFEVYWPLLDRSKIDPTIFERSFSRVMGLARLLVFERLPGPNDRDKYLAKRRAERGRPELSWNRRSRNQLHGNIKDSQPDDIAEWVEEDAVSNYHTFTIPYGPHYNARRIEKLLFTKDLLLNAEWNKSRDRQSDLHRHPCFMGSASHIIHDCCGSCPEPVSDEDLELSEEYSKLFVSGDISFLKDNPGRQEIGSFYPITTDDWTEMAYVGDTARLCQAIVDGDHEHVDHWCKQQGADVNRRDHTGRTPLQLAAMSSTPEVVQCLVDHGARIVARMQDGFTALHISCQRGNAAMVKAMLEKSETNEAEHARVEDLKKEAMRATRTVGNKKAGFTSSDVQVNDENNDWKDDLTEDYESSNSDKMTEGSFVKVSTENGDGGLDEPDVYDVNVLAWDAPFSPLHLAIAAGNLECVDVLVSTFGADVLLPVKLLKDDDKSPRAAILTLILALRLPLAEACKMTEKLLNLGASSKQADMNGISALQYIVNSGQTEILEKLLTFDEPAAKRAVTHLSVRGYQYSAGATTPLITAIKGGYLAMTDKLLDIGAEPTIRGEAFVRAYHRTFEHASHDPEIMERTYEDTVEQPIIAAAMSELPSVVRKLLDRGADVSSLLRRAFQRIRATYSPRDSSDLKSLLDIVQDRIEQLREYNANKGTMCHPPGILEQDDVYLKGLSKSTYRYWLAKRDLAQARSLHRFQLETFHDSRKKSGIPRGTNEKEAAIVEMLAEYEAVEKALLAKGAKIFKEMYPDVKVAETPRINYGYVRTVNNAPYSTTHKFLVPDLTEVKIDGYFRLYQEAWEGDIPAVKALTLGTWGSNNQPLQIAVRDHRGFSPFSIAVLRGHLDLARVVLEIAFLQYQPKEPNDNKAQLRYRIGLDEDSSDLAESFGDNERVNVVSELVDDIYTIDDIGKVADTTRSRVFPGLLLTWQGGYLPMSEESKDDIAAKDFMTLDWLSINLWTFDAPKTSWAFFHALYDEVSRCECSLIRYAIAKDDMRMLQFLTEIGNGIPKIDADQDGLKVCGCSQLDFTLALRLGRIEMIGHLIAVNGAGISLQKLIETYSLTIQEKPKYYQGLSIYGKKRKDWADQGRGVKRSKVDEAGQPPYLSAVFEGNVDSTEYFLGDAPLRRYQEFAAANKDDRRIQTLTQAKGGIGKVLSTWLSARNNLAIHMAVMSKPRKDGSNPCLDFLIRVTPENIEARSSSGTTPLQLAFQLNRLYAAKTLMAAGANQAIRNRTGENLVHSIIQANSSNPNVLSAALALLDQSVIPIMLTERCTSSSASSLTPLALWIHSLPNNDSATSSEILQIVLNYSQGADLEMLDGAGNHPLNFLVRTACFSLVESIIRFKPSLLLKENAVGMTPLDTADKAYLNDWVKFPPSISHLGRFTSIVDRPSDDFLPENIGKEVERPAVKMWRLVHQAAQKQPDGKRQLVSLLDANEVAKRLAERQRDTAPEELEPGRVKWGRKSQYGYRTARERVEEMTERGDEVSSGWTGQGRLRSAILSLLRGGSHQRRSRRRGSRRRQWEKEEEA